MKPGDIVTLIYGTGYIEVIIEITENNRLINKSFIDGDMMNGSLPMIDFRFATDKEIAHAIAERMIA